MIILNSGVNYIEALVEHGLLKDIEAEHLVEEIEESLDAVLSCTAEDHPGELPIKEGEEKPKRKSIFGELPIEEGEEEPRRKSIFEIGKASLG
jgi:hypothetical protein